MLKRSERSNNLLSFAENQNQPQPWQKILIENHSMKQRSLN